MLTTTEGVAPTSQPRLGGGASTDLVVGELVGEKFRVIGKLGSGASGHVFEVEHTGLGRRFALKLLRPEIEVGSLASRRFVQEARVAAAVRNEHVITMVDCGEYAGRPYLVMELCDGRDLRGVLTEAAPMSAPRAIRLIIEAARGVGALHDRGLVHRDLKPENLFVTRRCTGEDWCKVLDFGVAKAAQSLSTLQGAIIGTVRYMAPEQLIDSSSVGPACDVYALAAILYECLSARPPHEGQTVQELMFRILNQSPVSLGELRPELPTRLTAIVMRCLDKSPGARLENGQALAHELERALRSGAESASNETLSEHPAFKDNRPRPSRLGAWVGGAAFLGLGFALGLGLGSSHPARASTEVKTSRPHPDERALQPSISSLTTSTAKTASLATENNLDAAPAPSVTAAMTSSRRPVNHVGPRSTTSPPAPSSKRPAVSRDFDFKNPYE